MKQKVQRMKSATGRNCRSWNVSPFHLRCNRDGFNYLVCECAALDIGVNIFISHEIQCNYDLLKEVTAPFMSLSGELQSDETITAALFLFMKKIMLVPSFTSEVFARQLLTELHSNV